MRIDKFLKASRIIKRRTLAKEVCDGNRVKLNGRPAKAGAEIAVGDRLTISFAQRILEVEVLLLKENPRVEEAKDLYQVIREERIDNNDQEV